MKRILVAVTAVAALSGCVGNSFNGTVLGNSLSVADAVFALLRDGTGKSQGLSVILSDKANICSTLKANRVPKAASGLGMTLFSVNAAGELLAPDKGDYTVITATPTSAGKYTWGSFSKTDSNCTGILTDAQTEARSGIIKVTDFKAETGGTLTGTFDITFGGQGDKVTGTIAATYCDLTTLPQTPNCE